MHGDSNPGNCCWNYRWNRLGYLDVYLTVIRPVPYDNKEMTKYKEPKCQLGCSIKYYSPLIEPGTSFRVTLWNRICGDDTPTTLSSFNWIINPSFGKTMKCYVIWFYYPIINLILRHEDNTHLFKSQLHYQNFRTIVSLASLDVHVLKYWKASDFYAILCSFSLDSSNTAVWPLYKLCLALLYQNFNYIKKITQKEIESVL